MKRSAFLALAVLSVAAMVMSAGADARIGGGRSIGVQRPSVAPRLASPPAPSPSAAANEPVMPATPGATLATKPAAPAAPAPSGASRWLGPLAGIAAGLGIAALLSHFGLPEGLGSFLLVALLVVGVVFVVRSLSARRRQMQRPLAYAAPESTPAPAAFEMPKAPGWGAESRIEPVLGSSAAAPPAISQWPAGFDAEGFVTHAKQQFVRLQAAHDAGNRKVLAEVLTPEMFSEVTRDLDSGGARTSTEILTLNAEVFDVATEGERHWASVRFTGTMRESGSPAPIAFDEVWNLTKPLDGSSGWLLAGIQQPA